VSAEEARKLPDGLAATPWRVAPHDDPGAGQVKDADGYYVNAEGDADAQIMAAAPDLAATVVRLHDDLAAYRAFALRIATLLAPPDAVDTVEKHLAVGDLDTLAGVVADTLVARSRNGRLDGLEEAAQVCSERADTREAAAEEMHKAREYSDATLYRTYATAERSLALTLAARAKVDR